MIERHSFRAMGTDVELLLAGTTADAFAEVEEEFERLEQSFSRFRPDSELSTLNRDGEIEASPDLLAVVSAAVAARERTNGLFDPTVHDALVAAGYDRAFDDLDDEGPAHPGAACAGEIRIEGSRVELAPGVRIDLGGIGKGYAVDRACDLLEPDGPCLVNAGGDLAARGAAWPVGVETPGGTITLLLEEGAIATSGRDRRRWGRRGGVEQHHLIDPRSGAPAEGDILRVTVVGRTATEAEVLAKAAFLGAEIDAPRVLVLRDGSTVLAGGLGGLGGTGSVPPGSAGSSRGCVLGRPNTLEYRGSLRPCLAAPSAPRRRGPFRQALLGS